LVINLDKSISASQTPQFPAFTAGLALGRRQEWSRVCRIAPGESRNGSDVGRIEPGDGKNGAVDCRFGTDDGRIGAEKGMNGGRCGYGEGWWGE
jgi:hypothetical protein